MRSKNAIIAILFGLFLFIGEIVRNWGDWQFWPFWLVDFIAAFLLIGGATLVINNAPRGTQFLSGAWGFTSAMFYMSFWGHIKSFSESAEGNIPHTPLTIIIGILWIITIIGFCHSLFLSPLSKSNEQTPT